MKVVLVIKFKCEVEREWMDESGEQCRTGWKKRMAERRVPDRRGTWESGVSGG